MELDYSRGPDPAAAVWWGHLDSSLMADNWIAAGHRLADAARDGDWPAVMRILDQSPESVSINRWRPGGKSWFTVLHQAAWHGAPTSVIAELIERGAWTSLRDAKGRTPRHVAEEVGLKKAPKSPPGQEPYYFALNRVLPSLGTGPRLNQPDALQSLLGGIINNKLSAWQGDRNLVAGFRHPPLNQIPALRIWFPVRSPGLRAGFHIVNRRGYLEVGTYWGEYAELSDRNLVTSEGVIRLPLPS